jgi:hypothetical protein
MISDFSGHIDSYDDVGRTARISHIPQLVVACQKQALTVARETTTLRRRRSDAH